nr:ribonuclease H-like domain-containing protein [Tanacetum cinerariifolium]
MFVHGYTDDDEFVPNNPTLISKFDISDPEHLHPNDSATLTFIKGNVQRPQTSRNLVRPFNVTRPSSSRNMRPACGSPLVCENCGFNGRTIDRCFKIIWYPLDFGKKNGSNNNTQNDFKTNLFNKGKFWFFFNNIELHAALVAAGLIVDSGANQHLIYSDKFLVNVIDISKFGIKVSHPNGTGALITKVGNMVLTKDITLYDVLVVSEYCVSLMSIHKIVRDSKLIIGFDESRCYVLPQDLREAKFQGLVNMLMAYTILMKFKGLNHVNFFNEVDVVDPGVSYDNFDNTSSQSDGSNHLRSVSPTFDHNEDDLGHLHGTNGFVDEDEMAATFAEHNSNYKDIIENILSPIGVE